MEPSPAIDWRGARVELTGLSNVLLNGAHGTAGDLDAEKGRVPVRLHEPAAAVEAHPHGVLIKPENLLKQGPSLLEEAAEKASRRAAEAARRAAAEAARRGAEPPARSTPAGRPSLPAPDAWAAGLDPAAAAEWLIDVYRCGEQGTASCRQQRPAAASGVPAAASGGQRQRGSCRPVGG